MTDPNILVLLKSDHEQIKVYLNQITSDIGMDLIFQIFKQVQKELSIHTSIEEQYFYPKLQEVPDLKDMILESFEEHKLVEKELFAIEDDFLKKEVTKDEIIAEITVLKENILHHIIKEENELFPKVIKVLNDEELKSIGEQALETKDDEK